MGIPELSSEQVRSMEEMVNMAGLFSQVVPDESKDNPTQYKDFMVKTRATEQLVELGLVEEITKQHSAKVAELYAQTDRHFKVYEVTTTGLLMFSDIETRSIN